MGPFKGHRLTFVFRARDRHTGKPVVDLGGDLAGILCLGHTSKNAASVSEDSVSQLKLVAGACNHRELTLMVNV